jgi:tRNA acetyltransferase TAN1
MSVVGSDFEKLKRFNLAELYPSVPKPDLGVEFKAETAAAMPESVTTDERLSQQRPTATEEQSA